MLISKKRLILTPFYLNIFRINRPNTINKHLIRTQKLVPIKARHKLNTKIKTCSLVLIPKTMGCDVNKLYPRIDLTDIYLNNIQLEIKIEANKTLWFLISDLISIMTPPLICYKLN